MKECKKEFIDLILNQLSTAPDSQIDNETKLKICECNGTYAEKYDTIVEISKLNLTKISSFIKGLCELDKYYLRPTEL